MEIQGNIVIGRSFLKIQDALQGINRSLHSVQMLIITTQDSNFCLWLDGFLSGLRYGQSSNSDHLIVQYAWHGSGTWPRGHKLKDHVLIGSPGILFDYARKNYFDLSQIKILIVGSLDALASSQGHPEQCFRIRRNLKSDCKIVLFSETNGTQVNELAAKLAFCYWP